MRRVTDGILIFLFASSVLTGCSTQNAKTVQAEKTLQYVKDEMERKRLHETFKIYAVLRSHNVDLAQGSLWELAETVREESKKHSLDPLMVLALINVESRFRPGAVSREGARGLMQLLPWVADALAEEAALEQWQGRETLDDPIINIKLGIFYLGYLNERFDNITIALTAYNYGPTRVQKKLARGITLPLGYAKRVLTLSQNYRETSQHVQPLI